MFKLIHEDARGRIWLLNYKDKEYLLLETKAGYSRGGDYHKTRQIDVVLSGKIVWIKTGELYAGQDPEEKGDHYQTLEEGDMTVSQPNYPHMMISITDSLVLEWLEIPEAKKSYYLPYRKIVEEMRNAK